ncbi:nickel-binding protein [Maribellus sediminis]|uniref:nickel-binding protein n=1 Tax=Maribellus sediminis TaxID=2696285 RepID=UPI001430492D|nr:nickel-binding protein [Maribellus sediminis]
MPIYMDRHDVSAEVTAENVAELHQQDLKVQHKFDCRGLTYWFDDLRKTAFCLIEAPSAEKLKQMHDHAHGEVPHRIIEVDPSIVESFLGRIEDPVKAKDTRLNIINDPAFRIIMAIEPALKSYKNHDKHSLQQLSENYKKQVSETVPEFGGRIASNKENRFLVSFTSVTKAVECALQLQSEVKGKAVDELPDLKIGLSAGVPVTEKNALFEDTVKLAESMCFLNAGISISEEINDLYRSENVHHTSFDKRIFVLSEADQQFLSGLVEFTENAWTDTGLNVVDFERHLALSKSKLYRKMTALIGTSPNGFLMHYRVKRIREQLHKKNSNIAEVAYNGGFNSPSYFAKCFSKVYGLTPSAYKRLWV